ncbi:MAG: VPLPA-CTERM sorting domain-containing protein [Proteobacteria bacterium]|nr:VPLPA-CTERM sorting domain-containing protein [Pseudomonadota bacterium]MBU1547897.1 VPLPA-CTERM sorting domain-containing protein [Pseudomonadota bacterium]
MNGKFFTIFACGVLTLFSLSFNARAQVYDDWSGYDSSAHEDIFMKSSSVTQERTMEVVRFERTRPGREINPRLREEGDIALSPGGTLSLPTRGGDVSLLPGSGSISLSFRGGDIAMSPGGSISVLERGADIAMSPGGSISVLERGGDFPVFPGGRLSVSAGGGDIPVSAVPLPGALWLLGSGFAGLVVAQRKKQ